jgi:threonine aldolase
MPLHDFRSDTVTLPTPEMMRAIQHARLGDAARGDDPTVLALEALACELTGKDDALLLPSGAMANLAAVMAHDTRGGEVIVEEEAHIYNAEGGGLSVVAGAVARPVGGDHGILSAPRLRAAIRPDQDLARAGTRLICLENTHNGGGGTVYPLATLQDIHGMARQAGIPVHLDGARLFNAATHLGIPILPICRHADSVWFSLCKGLGGPIGAMLAGEKSFMQKARRAAKMLGGGMRQAGLIAAPALVALQEPYGQHRRDHAIARRLATGLAGIDASLVDLGGVQTNIVNCHVRRFAEDADAILQRLREHGVLALGRGSRIRFVTHAQVDEASADAAVHALAEILPSFAASHRQLEKA